MDRSKQNRIKSAYGIHYDYFKAQGIDDNGFTGYDKAEVYKSIDGAAKPGAESKLWRPVVLVGIEHNNNWNKIGPDYPKPPSHADEFWIIAGGVTQTYRGRLKDSNKTITHWQYNKAPFAPIH